jgi:hypothetical protein
MPASAGSVTTEDRSNHPASQMMMAATVRRDCRAEYRRTEAARRHAFGLNLACCAMCGAALIAPPAAPVGAAMRYFPSGWAEVRV